MGNRQKIGYLASLDPQEEKELETLIPEIDLSQIESALRLKGLLMAVKCLKEYLDKSNYPFVDGKDRDDMLMDKISKIKCRYYDPI